jgi:hypothetical protein
VDKLLTCLAWTSQLDVIVETFLFYSHF